MSIGKNIQSLRLQHGLSQKELASIIGVTDKAVSAWEKGRITPRMGAIQKMADYFHIKKSDIIEPVAVTLKSDIIEPVAVTLKVDTLQNVSRSDISLKTDEAELLNGYRELNEADKSMVLGIVGRLNFA